MKTTEQVIKLTDLTKGSFLYSLAKAKIDHKGFYTCTYKGLPTRIVK